MSPYGDRMLLLLLITFWDTAAATDCSIYNSAGKFEIADNRECTLSSDLSAQTVTVYGKVKVTSASLVTIQATTIDIKPGAEISADAVAGSGPGQGNSQGSGGGYGGRGGSPASRFLTSSESVAYGSTTDPRRAGSPGGGSNKGYGGGAILLNATGNIEINGILSANGGDASGNLGGGGSGGSIYLDASIIQGSGVITARGGNGFGNGGGGSGGRIILKHGTLASTVELFADGGLGGNTETLLQHTSTSASSSERYYPASYGYIGNHASRLWRPVQSAYSGAYLEMTLNANYYVTAIQTKGGSSYYVKSYTVRYYNTTAAAWQSIGDENYVFGSNTNAVTKVKLPRPVYTSRIRLYPKSWSSGIELAFRVHGYSKVPVTVPAGICSPATEGGPGGPGTILFMKTNSPSTLVVNNFGKSPYIGMDDSCQNMDVLTQGAAAYLFDTVRDLEDLVIYDGSHVVFEANQVVTNILGDGRSIIHILKDTTVDINGKMTTGADVKAGSAIRFSATPTVEIVSMVNVSGSFDLIYPDKQSLVLESAASVTINSTSTTRINCTKLEVKTNAELNILKDNEVFHLETTEFKIDGRFLANELKIYDVIKKFVVGINGVVDFDPVGSDMYLGPYIDIRGDVTLNKHVSVVQPCTHFLLEGGKLNWNKTSDIIKLGCSIVKINNVFSPGTVSFEAGVGQLVVGSSGTFTFKADGPIRVNSVSIAGKMIVENIATFESHISPDKRITEFEIHGPNGFLHLNQKQLPAQIDSKIINQPCNILKVKSLAVDKTFYADKLSLHSGIDDLSMFNDGYWRFSVCDTFRINKINSSGTIISTADHLIVEATTIDIKAGGKVSADGVATTGPGTGNNRGSGGGYGGRGGSPAGSFLTNTDSMAYGGFVEPLDHGSPGGGAYGGKGGGAILLNATGYIEINGILSANGGDATGSDSGGGSGGSIYIDANTIRGSGVIYARGGDGSGEGGGGGGGRITLKHTAFSSTLKAFTDGGLGGAAEVALGHSSMDGSSQHSSYPLPYGYLGTHSSRSWRPRTQADAYLELVLSTQYYVTSLETRGGPASNYYVKSYTVRFYNSTSHTWQSIGDENYIFIGNVNGGGIVKNRLPRPLYTNRIRIYPESFNGGIELAFRAFGYARGAASLVPTGICKPASKGGPGGPGTLYYLKKNSASTVVIDNIGKNTYVKLDADCKRMDVLSQGGAAFILDHGANLAYIIINDGSHVVVASDHTLKHVYGDGRSMIHVVYNTTLNIDGDMTAHAHIHKGSSMNFNADLLSGFVSSIYVSGSINLTKPINQSLILAEPASVTIDSVSMTRIHCLKMEIREKAELNIMNENETFHLEITEIKANGKFFAHELKIYDVIERFIVGSKGVVDFDPVSSDMYIGAYIDIRGKVTLKKYVSIVYPCNQFLLERGTLTWPATSDIITMECAIVKINSAFSPGIISFGAGVNQFTIGQFGSFSFIADGPVLVNTVSIAGKMFVRNIASLESHTSTDRRIGNFHIHSPGGLVQLSFENLASRTNATATNQRCSILKAKSLTIDKIFNARDLDIDAGIDDISVNTYGSWSFGPCDTFKVHELYVNGTVTSAYPLTLVGKHVHKVHTIHIDVGGTVTLNSNAQSTRAWTSESTIGVHDFTIDGTLKAGLLKNYINNTDGWDRLNVNQKGSFFSQAHGQMMIDYLYVDGHFESYRTVRMNGSDTDLIIYVGSHGNMVFDSLVTSKWEEESDVQCSRIQMDSGSTWQSRNTRWTVQEAVISGKLYSYPSSDALIVFFTIRNGGLVDFSRTSVIKGNDVSVDAGGTFDIEYQHVPVNTSEGLGESKLLYKTVIVSGTLKAGSVYIGHLGNGVHFLENITISGTVDVSGGGYIYDRGPGKGQINTQGASGASHGGRGGRGYSGMRALQSYGYIFTNRSWGSGGGSHSPFGKSGGRGGGYVYIDVRQNIKISGNIKANGLDALSPFAGGGSGGDISIHSDKSFELTGHLYCNGGKSLGKGGGGAGGRIHAYFKTANYHSGYVQAIGGSSGSGEDGGPGMSYFQGDTIRNLRVDNGCQQPKTTEPTGSVAGATEFDVYRETGAIAYLRPPSDNFTFDFTHVELYGGAHLTMNGTGTVLKTEVMYGDDTGHLHIGPGHMFLLTKVARYERANVTYEVFLYEDATWITPEATLEFRQVLDQRGLGMPTQATSCPANQLRSTSGRFWGPIEGTKTHVLVSTGGNIILGLAGIRENKFANLTVQDRGILDLRTKYGDERDIWNLEVRRGSHNGLITVEAGGLLKARNLKIDTDILKVEKRGVVSLSGQGLTGGNGGGSVGGGGSYGGRGGNGNNGGTPGHTYGSAYNTKLIFGSGGHGASTTYGTGGGILDLDIRKILQIEGVIESNGKAGHSTTVAGGSGGFILINARDLEGSGSIQVTGGSGATNTGAGGGGRIAIYYKTTLFWFGQLDARGGSGSAGDGGAGTVYMKDMVADAQNETLIIDNFGRTSSTLGVTDHSYAGYNKEGGRTWLDDSELKQMDTIKIVRNAHLAIHPNLKSNIFDLKAYRFEGDTTGSLHVGPEQQVIVQHPDDLEFLVNVYVYEGGTLLLPSDFTCYNIKMHIWGTIGVHDITVGEKCSLYLGKEGTTKRTGVFPEKGVFDFEEITVAAGGEIASTTDITGANDILNIKADKFRVKGGGRVHAVKVNIEAATLIVDDLGEITGDLHDVPCNILYRGKDGTAGSGAGHGGRGGGSSDNVLTGAPYGHIFEPTTLGCSGGKSSVSGRGGRGGGAIYLNITKELQNDGEISCNGESGTGASGGGSGGSIFIDVANIKGYGEFQVTGGDGSSASSKQGCGGSGGRIAMYFNRNFTFSGSWDVFGGNTPTPECDGASGTAFFYHNGYKHSTLLINNIGRGVAGEKGVIADYSDLSKDTTHTWFLPHHGTSNRFQTSTNKYYFDELQIYGNAHLAVLTNPVGLNATIYFENMIGDRTGAIHVGANQVMDLKRQRIDLPFNVHVYPDGFLGLAPDTYVQDIDIFLNGTLAYVENLTLHHDGNLWLYKKGRTNDLQSSFYEFKFVHVKTGGYIHMITDPVEQKGIHFTTISTHIDGGGLIRGTHLYFKSLNITIDAGGHLNADYLGYRVEDINTNDYGIYGRINPGRGHTGSVSASGAGHGGSGARGEGETMGGSPYGDIYEPTLFGSSGGGNGGGRGGGRVWLNVTNTIHIDGKLTANGADGVTDQGKVGGGGSGGSIWLHTNRVTGFGLIQAQGGKGSYFKSSNTEKSGGGGAGGRIAMYFKKNVTFSEFRYLANGGWPGRECDTCEAGGPGTAFLYHMLEDHRTLIVDNNGAPSPRDLYVNWNNIKNDGGRAWILPISGIHAFAMGTTGGYAYEFEELQIYGNAHLAVKPPTADNFIVAETNVDNRHLHGSVDEKNYNVIIFFKYMIGDRTGSVHIAAKQAMDLMTGMEREEMDLPYNTYTYRGSYLGLAPMTFVHGVEIHLSGIMANVNNITLRLGGYLWLRHGGRTVDEVESTYKYDYVKIQDDSSLNATTDPIDEEGITFNLKGLTIEGGGIMHGTYVTVNAENVTVDAGALLSADGLGYKFEHDEATHGSKSVHGKVNPGAPDPSKGQGGGAGHGGTGGKEAGTTSRAGFAYGDIYEPQKMGSSGGAGLDNRAGGSGGGRLWFNVTDTIFIDGIVSANGVNAVHNGAGGGSGGSIWMHCNIIQGYGLITAHGGKGSTYSPDTGSGGAGGRVAVYFNINETMSTFRYLAYGGPAGGVHSENGGAGTVFIYNKFENHTTLILDNNGQHPRNKYNVINDYADLTYDSCRTWILPESGYNKFADGKFAFHFNELQIYGAAHMAVLPEPVGTPVDIFFLYMIGDRTGTMHIGDEQDMDLHRPEIDLPFNVRVYPGGFLGLAPKTIIHGVTIWLWGELDHVENLTLHHQGYLALHSGSHTTGNSPDNYTFFWVRIQDNATISILTDPVSQIQSNFTTNNGISMEGGSWFYGPNMKIIAANITLDFGATIHADSLGYRPEDPQTPSINRGLGTTSSSGSSGAGHGGTSGKGAGTELTGQPYGHLFQPHEIGSAGGGGRNVGGQGGGMLYIQVSDRLMIDGEIRVNGGDGKANSGGGGSGGTIIIDTYNFRGMGNITANGGSRYAGGTGGGGAGGRIAIYFRKNVTYWGEYQCHGGYSVGKAESGGPGLVFIYNVEKNHSTLYINNRMRQTTEEVNLIRDYTDISRDRFKAWILPESSDHWLAGGNDDYRFNELQIFGNAHLALLPKPYEGGCNLHFLHMIGDRTGFIHVGPYQVMDLKRLFLDTPFSSYVYNGGYLGLATETFLESVFLHIEGTVDHIHNLTLMQRGALKLFKTGSTNRRAPLNYVIKGLTVIKAESYINCSSPNADRDAYNLRFGWIIVEGGGLIKGGNLNITATDFTVDDGGYVDVSDGGHLPGQGPAAGTWSILGSSGASHGGIGGRGGCGGYITCRLERNLPYGNLYTPNEHGSGGALVNGGTGGGIIHMHIAHTLAVDGYIKANSKNTVSSNTNGASGGSGGSITIQTHNFTGSHTGHIQAIGGSGDVTKGGGGAGGRIALYHSRHVTIPHYRGYFDSFGGKPGTSAEAGAAGTVYVHDGERSYSMLQIDNNGQRQIAEETTILNEGHRIDLSSSPGQYSTSRSYTTKHGHAVSVNQDIYVYYSSIIPTRWYRLHHLFDQTVGSSWTDHFMANAGSARITITLNQQMYINKIKVYPTVGRNTKFKITGYNKLSGATFDVTSNYILPSNHGTQGSYIDLPVGKEAVKFDFDLIGVSNTHVALSEIEIFADPSPDELRYKHISLGGASTWIFADRNEQYTFSEVYLKGQSHLAFRPKNDFSDGIQVDVGKVIGDKTGYLHVGYNQEISMNKTAYDVPFNTHVYEKGHVTYPPRTFFYKTKLTSSGKISGLEDLYVFKGGLVSIDTNGSIATNHSSAVVSLKSLHVQEAGTFEMKSYTSQDSFNIDATNISIYGGGHFKVNTALNMTVHHLLAVYSGGKLDLSGAGFQSNSVNHGPGAGIGSRSGGSGGGHGGSGGRGSGLTSVGTGYDSMYEPHIAGSAGGHGYHFGELYFGDNAYGNTVVRKGLGGAGGGILEVHSRHVDIDGLVAANGMNPDSRSDRGAGGGAGGAIWIVCEEVVGHGTITAYGGNGGGAKGQAGGGGAGGRISVQCDNIHKFNVTMKAYGGVSNSETGGAGTAYLEARYENGTLYKQKLLVDNNGHDYPHAADYNAGFLINLLNGEYNDISNTGGVTWLYHDRLAYSFKELDVRGNAHVAILSDTDNEVIDLRVGFLWGDRSGVLHAGRNQTFGLSDVDVYLPTNLAAYRYSRIEVPSKVTLREVWAEINGTIEGMNVIAVENEGELYIWSYANSDGYKEGQLVATNISIRAGGKFEPLTAVEQMNLIVTRLVINGNGYVRTNNLKLNATNVTVDLSGDFHADYTGFPGSEGPGGGRNANSHEGGGTGGGHGGRGGRCKSGYYSAYAYDSIYFPTEMGSGGGNSPSGNGGRGGGIIHMYIKDELRVEGRLHSNGERGGDSKAGGGAGGSLYISANHLDGTGSIEVTGGAGGTTGGGGGGGRITIYHTDQNHFTGKYLVHGGWGAEQYGGPGTVYLESHFVKPVDRRLIADNGGHSTSNRIYEVERLDLGGNYYSTHSLPEMTFHSHSGVNTTTDSRPYYVHHSNNYYSQTYPISYLFSHGKANVKTFYLSNAKQATLTIDLPYKTYVEYLRIFPYCQSASYMTSYAVGSSLEGGSVTSHTNGYINTDYCQTQKEIDQYGTVEIRDNVDKIIIHLRATGNYVALSEIEVYVREDPTSKTQTPYSNGNGAGYILPEKTFSTFTFDKMEILGGASLNLDGKNMKLTAHEVAGDDTGRLTLRQTQTYNNTQDRVLQTFGILTQRESSLNLPLELDCRGVDLYVKGYFHSMENFTVNARCNLTIDHHKITENFIDNLDIKTFGSVTVFTEEEALTTLVGTSLTVRSGARLTSNDLKLDYFNVTIEPYGLLTVTEGCPYKLQHEGIGAGHGHLDGSSGGGHGGNGGQGERQPIAGGAHASFLYPTKFGKNGGHSKFPHLGGTGGGRMYLKVNHTLTVDGFLTAQGGNWRSVAAGGGSGGTIHIETYTIDGSGEVDASGGAGYGGSWSKHGGGGGGGRVTLYYMYNFFVGDFINHGGPGGSRAEPGGPGTVYLHRLPELVNGTVPSDFIDNRTLYLNNKGYQPRVPDRNLTDTYSNYTTASGVVWIWPGSYPPSVTVATELNDTEEDIVLDFLKVYEKVQLAMVRPRHTEQINLIVGFTEGDRSGHVHIGYNQTLFIELKGTGALPMDVSLYHGSLTTLQGELRVAGVTVVVEGIIGNVENMTIVDGGTLRINYMMDLKYQRIDDITFTAFSIRNRGSLFMNNDVFQHNMTGKSLQIFPGGKLEAKNLYMNVETLTVDVMATLTADGQGYCNMKGSGAGYTVSGYGTGASHGGEAGAENYRHNSPSCYGNFIKPDRFGSAGGDGGSSNKGGCGGGILILNANKLLKVDGTVSANGHPGSSGGGGGSGGSIYATTGELDGSGTIEVKGGSGRNGGAGGRLGIAYDYINFAGSYISSGGVGNGGENGAAGTVFTKDTAPGGKKTVRIYNRKGDGNRKTRITIPESKTEDHDIDTLDLGDYAEVGLLATDDNSNSKVGRRDLYLRLVEGDYTATVHVEGGMWLNIDFNDSAVLSFSVAVYPDGQVNLPYDTYVKDVTVSDYGGTITGLETFNISRGGAVNIYPPSVNNPHFKNIVYNLNTISILDGGVLHYFGSAEAGDVLEINLDGDLMIRGGGELKANKLILTGIASYVYIKYQHT